MYKIGLIGVGNIGSQLAKKWAAAGHRVLLGVRDASSPAVIDLLKTQPKNMEALTVKEAADAAAIIVICVGYPQLKNALDQIGVQKNKLIIQTVNASFDGGKDAAKTIEEATQSSRIIKAFNSVGAEVLDDPSFQNINADTFICGGEKDDVETVTTLAKEVGFENVYHIGGIEKEALLEQLAQFWGALAFGAGLGRNTAFKILTKQL